ALHLVYNGVCQTKVWSESLVKSFTPPPVFANRRSRCALARTIGRCQDGLKSVLRALASLVGALEDHQDDAGALGGFELVGAVLAEDLGADAQLFPLELVDALDDGVFLDAAGDGHVEDFGHGSGVDLELEPGVLDLDLLVPLDDGLVALEDEVDLELAVVL